jgi:predicted small secreted protein
MKLNTFIKLCLAVASIALSAGCATVEGVGKDVERAGEAVQDAADN